MLKPRDAINAFSKQKTAMLKCFMIFPEPKNNDKARKEIIKSDNTKT